MFFGLSFQRTQFYCSNRRPNPHGPDLTRGYLSFSRQHLTNEARTCSPLAQAHAGASSLLDGVETERSFLDGLLYLSL